MLDALARRLSRCLSDSGTALVREAVVIAKGTETQRVTMVAASPRANATHLRTPVFTPVFTPFLSVNTNLPQLQRQTSGRGNRQAVPAHPITMMTVPRCLHPAFTSAPSLKLTHSFCTHATSPDMASSSSDPPPPSPDSGSGSNSCPGAQGQAAIGYGEDETDVIGPETQTGGAPPSDVAGVGDSPVSQTEEILLDATMAGNVMLRNSPNPKHKSNDDKDLEGTSPITPEGNMRRNGGLKVPTSTPPIKESSEPPSASFPA